MNKLIQETIKHLEELNERLEKEEKSESDEAYRQLNKLIKEAKWLDAQPVVDY